MNQYIENKSSDEIDLKLIFQMFLRNKNFIFLFTFLITSMTILFSFSLKPIWRGRFNVVVKSETNSTLGLSRVSSSAMLDSIIRGGNDNKKTQELILQSPSVLMPVYKFVKESYKNKNISTKKLDFESWRKKELSIKFKKNSRVLTITHQNTDKSLILDTLNLISEKYKDYSRKDRALNLNRIIKYLEDQKIIMEEKSIASMKKLNKFSIENGLGNLDGFVALGNSQDSLISSFDISDNSKILSALKNSELNLNQSQIDGSSEDNKAGQRFKNQYNLLEMYESQYTDLSAKLKNSSKYLNQLKIKIDNLRSSLKRPNEILIEFNSLKKLAKRDEKLLNDIENNLEIMKLEQVKIPNPWSMISQPTIDRIKVFPKKTEIALIAFLISFISSGILSYLKELFSGIIYNNSVITEMLDCKYLGTIYIKNSMLSKYLLDKLFSSYSKNILIINIKNKANNDFLNSIDTQNKLIIKDFKDKDFIEKSNDLFIVIEKDTISKTDLLLINNYISVLKEKIKGWIFIDNTMNII